MYQPSYFPFHSRNHINMTYRAVLGLSSKYDKDWLFMLSVMGSMHTA